MVKWLIRRAIRQTWDRHRLGPIALSVVIAIGIALLAPFFQGGPPARDGLIRAAALVATLMLLEAARYVMNFARLWRNTPGVLRTIRLRT